MPLKLIPPGDRKGSKVYYVRGTVTGYRNGQPVTVNVERSTRETRKREAEAARSQIEASVLEAIRAGHVDVPTVADLASRYMDRGGDTRFLAPIIRLLGETRASDLTQEAVDDAAAEAYPGRAASTVNRQFHTPLIALGRKGARGTHFPFEIERPENREGTKRLVWMRPRAALHHVEAVRAMNRRPTSAPAMLAWLYGEGCRMGETILADVSDLNLDDGFALLRDETTKARTERRLALSPLVVAELRALPWVAAGEDGPVFRSTRGGRYRLPRVGDGEQPRGGQIDPWFHRGLVEAAKAGRDVAPEGGARITPHGCRHSFGTWHYSVHRDTVTLRRHAGWASDAMLDTYVKRASASIADEARECGWGPWPE